MKLLILSITIAFSSIPAWAVTDLVVRERLEVFENPQNNSKKVTELVSGDVVVISDSIYGDYRKVLVTYGGQRKAGYVRSKAIVLSIIKERGVEELNPLLLRWSLIADLNVTVGYAKGGTVKASGFPGATSQDLLGYDTVFAFGALFPWNRIGAIEVGVGRRNFNVSGDVEYIAGAGLQSTTIKETTNFVHVFGRYYDLPSSTLWKGVGLEVGQISDVLIEVNDGQEIPYSGKKEIYLIPSIGMGMDLPIHEKWILSPKAKFGIIATRSPIALNLDLGLSIQYFY